MYQIAQFLRAEKENMAKTYGNFTVSHKSSLFVSVRFLHHCLLLRAQPTTMELFQANSKLKMDMVDTAMDTGEKEITAKSSFATF